MKLLLTLLLFLFNSLTAKQSMAIFTAAVVGLQPWDPESINNGITGSEEAVIYISKHLADLGYRVVVFGNPPANSKHRYEQANPRYLSITEVGNQQFDIGISWRMPQIGPILKTRAKQVYFWPHDICTVVMQPKEIDAFTGVLWLSKWQKNNWIAMNPGLNKFDEIFGNGIEPTQFKPVENRKNPHSCIYGSNYARGLEILLDIWPKVKAQFPAATLDIYYGWQHWGLLTPEKELKMRSQIMMLANFGVKEHGLVGHEELNRAYENASLWTYPCTAPETFCISAIRAQLAGAIPVIIEGSALPETVQHGYKCNNPNEYYDLLVKAMHEAEKMSLEERKKMGVFILKDYTWEAIARKWKAHFDLMMTSN